MAAEPVEHDNQRAVLCLESTLAKNSTHESRGALGTLLGSESADHTCGDSKDVICFKVRTWANQIML